MPVSTKTAPPDVWKEEERKIFITTTNKWEKMSGLCYGPFIILPGTSVGTVFLCHVPTFSDMVYLFPQEKVVLLKRIGEYLADNFPMTFRQKHKLLLHSKLPIWVSAWVKNVAKGSEWVNPDEFRESHPELWEMTRILIPEEVEQLEDSP